MFLKKIDKNYDKILRKLLKIFRKWYMIKETVA
jgi:hypothetical protein